MQARRGGQCGAQSRDPIKHVIHDATRLSDCRLVRLTTIVVYLLSHVCFMRIYRRGHGQRVVQLVCVKFCRLSGVTQQIAAFLSLQTSCMRCEEGISVTSSLSPNHPKMPYYTLTRGALTKSQSNEGSICSRNRYGKIPQRTLADCESTDQGVAAQSSAFSTLTAFHLFVFGSGALSLAATNLDLPLELIATVGMWRRINALLVL